VSSDIDPILRDWPYHPDRLTVRLVEGLDGQRKIQLRLDLGVLQMDIDGRPDGRRIHECDSWFEFHQRRQQEHDAANPDGVPYLLEPEDCAELLREGGQYYHRYVCFWQLGWYELCARDTLRNLRLFAFVREHARQESDKRQFDQWRPYVTMMHARAVATPLVELEQWDAAAGVLDAGIRGIERFLEEYNQTEKAAQVGELRFLRRWKEEIVAKIKADAAPAETASATAAPPKVDRLASLRAKLRKAIREEQYEEAARLRNEIEQHRRGASPGDESDA
jgi:hypothetical protein